MYIYPAGGSPSPQEKALDPVIQEMAREVAALTEQLPTLDPDVAEELLRALQRRVAPFGNTPLLRRVERLLFACLFPIVDELSGGGR